MSVTRNQFGQLSYIGVPSQDIVIVLKDGTVTSLELSDINRLRNYVEIFRLLDSSEIKELSLPGAICADVNDDTFIYLDYIFARVHNHLESLVCAYSTNIIQLMGTLNALRSLTLRNAGYDQAIAQYFSTQTSITRLTMTMESRSDAFRLLRILSENPSLRNNLTELNLHILFDADTLEIIKKFRNLQVLRIDMGEAHHGDIPSVDFTGFPDQLWHIKIGGLKISSAEFFSLVQRYQSLEVFDVGRGDIFLDTNSDIGYGDSRVSKYIAVRLMTDYPQRKVTILRIKPLERMDYQSTI